MKVIYFAPRFPLPVTGGDRLLTEQYLRAFGGRWEVHFVGFGERGEAAPDLVDQLRRECGLASATVFPLGASRVWRAAAGVGRGWPLQLGYYHDRNAERRFRRLVEEIGPDAVIFQTVRLLPYLDSVREGIRVVNFVDALSKNYRRSARVGRSVLHRLLYRFESRLLVEMEREALRRADATYVVSRRDAEYLGRLGSGAPPRVVPNGVDPDFFHFRELPPTPRYQIAFLGRMSTRANEDAAVWFVEEVLPLVRARLGRAVRFVIIGASPSQRVRALQSDQVAVTGEVADVRPLVWESDMTVAPMRIATGSQFKILQSIALGRPVVTTPTCLRGLGVASTPGLLAGETAEETAERVVATYEAYDQLRGVMPRLRAEIADRFSWERSLQDLMDSVEGLVTASGVPDSLASLSA